MIALEDLLRYRNAMHLALILIVGCSLNSEPTKIAMKKPDASKFIFDGREYRITKAQITASIGDPYWCDTYNKGQGKSISWAISFNTATDDDELPPPNVDFDGIQIEAKNWHQLLGTQIEWQDAINSETNDRYGLIYVYDHELISNGSIRITARDGAKFQIIASGQDEEGQRFIIDAPAEFKGIYVRGSEFDSDQTIHARLNQHVDDVNLTGTPFKLDYQYDSGVKMGQSFYSPVIE